MKRPRGSESSLRRTTSLTELASPPEQGRPPTRPARGQTQATAAGTGVAWGTVQRRHSEEFLGTETAAFLKACGLCNRRLGPGRDTFIYMGEVAFCSLECRQQQMNLDELKEKKWFSTAGAAAVAAARTSPATAAP